MPATVVGISSDVLYPTHEQHELVGGLPSARYVELDAPHGHDAFLIEGDAVSDIVAEHLAAVALRAA